MPSIKSSSRNYPSQLRSACGIERQTQMTIPRTGRSPPKDCLVPRVCRIAARRRVCIFQNEPGPRAARVATQCEASGLHLA